MRRLPRPPARAPRAPAFGLPPSPLASRLPAHIALPRAGAAAANETDFDRVPRYNSPHPRLSARPQVAVCLTASTFLAPRRVWTRCGQTASQQCAGELFELKQALNSAKKGEKRDAVKKVIASMTVGKDVSSLFSDVINCMQARHAAELPLRLTAHCRRTTSS